MLFKKLIQFLFSSIDYYYHGVSVFHHPTKQIYKPNYLVPFNSEEQVFLEKCAYSFNHDVDYSRGFRQKELYTVSLANVTFLGNSGALILKNKVVIESVFDQMRLVKSPAFRSPNWLRLFTKSGLYTSIMHLPWAETSNYHWFMDCLPRLYLLLKTSNVPIRMIIPEKMPRFQVETLRFLLEEVSNIEVVKIKKDEKWRIDSYVLPSFVSNHYSGYLPREIMNFIQAKIWQGYKVTNQPSCKRIYISRKKATKRRILNEEHLTQFLLDQSFEIVFAEDLSYQQQVQLFYNTEVVVAPHGAGLTNILFCRRVNVLELHPADLMKSHYFMLCISLGFQYLYSIGSSSDCNMDFEVNLIDVKSKIKKLLNKN